MTRHRLLFGHVFSAAQGSGHSWVGSIIYEALRALRCTVMIVGIESERILCTNNMAQTDAGS